MPYMKKCSMCLQELPFSEFYKSNNRKSGYQSRCKACCKVYEKSWRELSPERKQRRQAWKMDRIAEVRSIYVTYMADKFCIDCGESDFVVLVHDHVTGEKRGGVQELINRGNKWEAVLEEIAKCEIRCCNCHIRKTATRGNWWQIGAYGGEATLSSAKTD